MKNQNQLGEKYLREQSFSSAIFLFFLFLFSSCSLPFSFAESSIKQVCTKDQCLTVEIADTDIERARGLQGRQALGDNAGMLFVFEVQGMYDFWMKDTKIALDMIWIGEDKTVVDIKTNVPPCSADPCGIYTPAVKAKYVLEIKAGQSDVFKFRVGDPLIFK